MSVVRQKFLMAAALGNSPLIKNQNQVCIADGAQPMSDDNAGASQPT